MTRGVRSCDISRDERRLSRNGGKQTPSGRGGRMQPQGFRRVWQGQSSVMVAAVFVTWGLSEKVAAASGDTVGLSGNACLDSDQASRSSWFRTVVRGHSAPPPSEREGLSTGPCPRKILEECKVLQVGDTSSLSDPGSDHPGPSPAALGRSHCEWGMFLCRQVPGRGE